MDQYGPILVPIDQRTLLLRRGGEVLLFPAVELRITSMITSKAATNDHLKTGHHEVTETGCV
jgi:hypothetical protein